MAERHSYRHGRLLWGYLRSNLTGRRERHPAIILDRDEDLIQPEEFDPRKASSDNIIHVLGVSTKYKKYGFPYVALPFTPNGHAGTGLREDCGAVIGWYDRLAIPDDASGAGCGFGGDVPAALMRQIDEAVRQDLGKRLGVQFSTVQKMFQELLGGDA